jgi:8-oxo-dGTP diphosphatase
MILPHRIAAGAIVIRDDRILLVRYLSQDGSSYLVAPGGAVEQAEGLQDAAIRETLEETGVTGAARKVLCIEELLCNQFKLCKVWILCEVVSGEVKPTEGAKREGIVEAKWYGRQELENETVFPQIIKDYSWPSLRANDWEAKCLGLRHASFD